MRINFHTTSRLWLHLEDYYNQGYTPEQVKEVIERYRDDDGNRLRCEPMGLNGNWIVEVFSNDRDYHARLVASITETLYYTKPAGKPCGKR